MSYTGHKKYISRNEKKQLRKSKAKAIFWGLLLCLLIYLFMRREDIYMYLKTYFY